MPWAWATKKLPLLVDTNGMVQKTLVFLSEGHLHDFAQGAFGTEELAGGKYCATTTHRAEGFGTEPPKWVMFIYFQSPTVDLPEGNSTV
jgi:hypothetical protein